MIVAAGRGTRFGRPKQLVEIAGAPMLQWSVGVFEAMSEIAEIVVVTEIDWIDAVRAVASGHRVVAGGATRQSSVHQGLRALGARTPKVLVHDGARPMITAPLVRRGMELVAQGHACVPAVQVVDTVKIIDPASQIILESLDRRTLRAAQTPQFATLDDMRRAHEAGIRDGVDATDDAMLLERVGVTVHVIQGAEENFKVTLPEDLLRAQRIMQAR